MADANSSDNTDVNLNGSDDQSAESQVTNESSAPNGPTEAERKLQSERDKMRHELDQLQGFALEQMRDKAVSKFLSQNKDKFPDVESEDFSLATSEEEFEDLAKKAQDRMDRVRNKALADVQNVPDDSLTPEQAQKELDKLEEKPEPGAFGKYLDVLKRTKR